MARRTSSLKEETLTPTLLEALKALNELACKRGQSLAQMSLAWLLNDSRVTSVIIGASSVNQLADNLKTLDNTGFSTEEIQRIEELSAPIQLR
jgi:L-glyceraldehyde 3-phosphate reductase